MHISPNSADVDNKEDGVAHISLCVCIRWKNIAVVGLVFHDGTNIRKDMKEYRFDVLYDGRYQGTFVMPLTVDVISCYVCAQPVISEKAIRRFVEDKRPSLKGKDFKIW